MIDPLSDVLVFDSPAITIRPDLTRQEFLEAPYSQHASDSVVNEPWHSWQLAGEYRSGMISFLVVLFFQGDRLNMVDLSNADAAFGETWSEYSLEKEAQREASHNRWLSECIGKKRKFDWGTVWSGVDQRGGGASIVIRYS